MRMLLRSPLAPLQDLLLLEPVKSSVLKNSHYLQSDFLSSKLPLVSRHVRFCIAFIA